MERDQGALGSIMPLQQCENTPLNVDVVRHSLPTPLFAIMTDISRVGKMYKASCTAEALSKKKACPAPWHSKWTGKQL